MTMLRITAAALFALLVSTQAEAASTCNIKEYSVLGATAGAPAQIAAEPSLVDQAPVSYASGVASSQPFNAQTKYICTFCDTQVSVAYGSSPQTATTSNFRIGAGAERCVGVQPGHVVSFISNP
jgi:hypothetical protein